MQQLSPWVTARGFALLTLLAVLQAENSSSLLAPDFSRFALSLAQIYIASPVENLVFPSVHP